MSTMQSEIYDAFIEAGASEPKARAAATLIAENQQPKADINLLKWMVGFNIAMTITIIGVLLTAIIKLF